MKSETSTAARMPGDMHEQESERARCESMVVPRGDDTAVRLPDYARALRAAPRPRETSLDDLELFCPFESGINPHADEVQAESIEWADRFGLIESDVHRAKLERSRIARLEALVFHTASREVLQLAADWTTLFCLLDDHVERDSLGPIELSAYLARVLSGFRDAGNLVRDPIANGFADLRTRMRDLAGEKWVMRFGEHLEGLFCGYLWEEINRRKKLRPSHLDYRTMRVDTIGLRPQFLFGELAEGIELPEPLRSHPDILDLEVTVSRAVGWANDIFTCSKEMQSGEVHNLVLVLMDSERLPLFEAVRRAAAVHDDEVRTFLSITSGLPEFGGADEAIVARYVHMLRCWIRGHLDWSSETGRYSKRLSSLPA